MTSFKRIYDTTVKKWVLGTGMSGVLGFLIFTMLAMNGDIEIISHSGDSVCAGTVTDPCYANITFVPTKDIFLYPMNESTRAIAFNTDPVVTSLEMYRTWGKGLRRIGEEPCTGSWCGCYWCTKSSTASYSYVFRNNTEYTVVFKAYKENPSDDIKWSFGEDTWIPDGMEADSFLDPVWYGVSNTTIESGNLILHIPCEGDFRDRSGNGHDGTQSGGVSIGRGVKGRGCEFDGTNDVITESTVSVANTNFTISYWGKEYSTISGQYHAVAIGDLRFGRNQDSVYIYSAGSGVTINTALGQNWDEWHNYVYTYNGTAGLLYMDGAYQSVDSSVTDITSAGALYIGARISVSYWNGSIDEVRIYNTSLSSSEVYDLYNANRSYRLQLKTTPELGLADDLDAPYLDNETGLVGHWNFNSDANDSSGYGNDGTVTATNVNARWDNGYYFPEVTDIISAPHSASLNVGSVGSQYSFGGWVKYVSGHVIISKHSGTPYPISCYMQTNKLRCDTNDGTVNPETLSTTLVNDGNWHHFIMYVDKIANQSKLYVDGVLEHTTNHTNHGSFMNTGAVSFGANNGGGWPSVSTLDEFRIYNRSLSASEVRDLYARGLVGHWKFDGDATDSSGYGNDATVYGGATLTNEGRFKEGYYFDGTDDFLLVSDNSEFDDGDFSFSFWMDTFDSGGIQRLINKGNIDAGTPGIGWEVELSTADSLNFFMCNQTGGPVWVQAVAHYTVDCGGTCYNKWTHVVGTWNSTMAKVYLDGVLRDDSGIVDSSFDFDNALDIYIGERSGASGGNFNGTMDEVKIYSRALSASEVGDLYNGTKSFHIKLKTTPTEGLVDETGLVAHWTMDSKDGCSYGSGCPDISGVGNDITTFSGPVQTNEGRFKEGFDFDGDGDYGALIGDTTVSTGNWTINAWVKPKSFNLQNIMTGWVVAVNGCGYISLFSNSGKLAFWDHGQTPSGLWRQSNTGTTLNEWNMATFNYNGSDVLFYLNGVADGSGVLHDAYSNCSIHYLGRFYDGSRYFNGTIDEVRVYNRSLTSTEVGQLYNGTKTQHFKLTQVIG